MEHSGLDKISRKTDFLLPHPSFLFTNASIRFGFNRQQLRKYERILIWDCIAGNTQMRWSFELIEDFQTRLFAEPTNTLLSGNPSLPLDVYFLERFADYLKWEALAENEALFGNKLLVQYFKTELEPYRELFEDRLVKGELPPKQFGQEIWEYVKDDLNFYDHSKELHISDPVEIVCLSEPCWWHLSSNFRLPWSAELIARYEDLWNWKTLSTNFSIPWNIEWMQRFEHHLVWRGKALYGGEDPWGEPCLGTNRNINWDSEMLSAFGQKFHPFDISISPSVLWDIDLLFRFEQLWDFQALSFNSVLWEKVFYEFQEEENLIPLLDMLLEDSTPQGHLP